MNEQNDVITKGLQLLTQAKEAQDTAQARAEGNPELEEKMKQFIEEDKEKKAPEFITCPCCGKPTLVKPLELNGPILDHYISCLVSGVPFSHTYPVYKGKLEITVSRLTKQQEQEVTLASGVIETLEGRIPEHMSILRDLSNTIKVYCSVKDIRLHTGSDKVFYPQDAVMQVCKELVAMRINVLADTIAHDELVKKMKGFHQALVSADTISAVPSPMLASIVETHAHLFYVLMDSGFDVNFWKGIELA